MAQINYNKDGSIKSVTGTVKKGSASEKRIAAAGGNTSSSSKSSSSTSSAQSAAQSVIDKAIASGNLANLNISDVTSAYTKAGGSSSTAAAANAAASKVSTPTPTANTYTVQEGDTLNSIAKKLGYSNYIDAGITSVPSGNFNLIRPGEVITIGGSKKATPTTTSEEIRDIVDENIIPPAELKDETLTMEDFMAKYEPKVETPKVPKYADIYTKQRESLGIEALEDEIGGYDTEKEDLLANLRKFKENQYADPESTLGFAKGRISTEEQGIQDRLDFITRIENAAIDKLNYKNKYLENIMSLTEKDYETARDEYEYEFNKNMQLADAFSDEQDKIKKDAQVTQTTIVNALKDSGKTWTDLTSQMQADINSRDLQAYGKSGISQLILEQLPDETEIYKGTIVENGKNYLSLTTKNKATGAISTKKILLGDAKESTGNTLTMNEAIDNGLPLSLVGKTESEVSKDLSLSTPPAWFKEIVGNSSLSGNSLQEEWDAFKEKISSNRDI